MTDPGDAAIATIAERGKLALARGDLATAWSLVGEALDLAPDNVELL
jgi:Flp pilus assembly protein TadD